MKRALPIAAAVVVAAVYLLRLDYVAGLYVDDAWYVLFGQALARGEGYTLVNSPTPGLIPPGPPGFPALLSLVFFVHPTFPGNVVWLKAISVAAMFGVGIISYRYFIQRGVPGGLAVGASVATALTPGFVFFATSSVMSECVFTLAQLSTLVILDRIDTRRTVIAALLAGITVLIRTAGLALVLGVTLYFLSARQFRRAAIFAVTVIICIAPWFWYEQTHRAPLSQRLEHGGAHVFTYSEQFWMHWAGDPSSGRIGISELPARIQANLVDVFGRDVAGIVMPVVFRGPSESGEEAVALGGGGPLFRGSMGSAPGTMVLSVLFSVVAVIGFVAAVRQDRTASEFLVPISLGVTILFPMWSYRFVLPLTPFLFFYLITGIRALAPGAFVRVSRVALLVVIGLHLMDHGQYIFKLRTQQPTDWVADAQEAEGMLDWMQQSLPPDASVATTNPPLVYLRTGRQTIASNDHHVNWKDWKRRGIRYMASLNPAQLPDTAYGYRVLYRSARRGYWVIEL